MPTSWLHATKTVAKAAVVRLLAACAPEVGLFESRGDLGVTPKTGSMAYGAATGECVTGGERISVPRCHLSADGRLVLGIYLSIYSRWPDRYPL